ncbi:tyrosine-type recombinase/integrase [Streptomyces sp. 4N509B]|uniref:tyrosine-type recombinase/integrase n=1 Tax=Streptomyces sp. 4N509B TaxID=3457413 RepID=UPI003FCF5EFA
MARKAVNNPRQIRAKSCGCKLCTEKFRPGEKPTRRDCTGPWQARWRDPGGRQCSKNFPTKGAAEGHLDEVKSAMRRGTYLDPTRTQITLEQWHAMWWPNQRGARSTLNRDERMWRLHVKPAFGSWPLTNITYLDVDGWVKRLLGPLGASSIPAAFQILDRLMTTAVLDRRVLTNPCDGIKLPKRRKKHPEDRRPPTYAQLDAIREHLPRHHHPMTIVAQETGLRFGELTGLRRCWVDLKGARVHVREVLEDSKGHLARKVYPKSDAGLRTVPLTPLAVETLTVHLGEHPADPARSAPGDGLREGELVFRGQRGRPIRQANFRTTWVTCCERAGVQRKTVNPTTGRTEWWPQFHSIRHAFASRLHELGVPEVVVQEILGHERGGDITWLYTHAASDVAGQVLAALTGSRPPLKVVESTGSPQPSHPQPSTTILSLPRKTW